MAKCGGDDDNSKNDGTEIVMHLSVEFVMMVKTRIVVSPLISMVGR